ncbi:MAG TPA: TIGR03435 family protein [Bryobacteraceae bacterium]|nr:TIGR03435 family protein [Bryobacteraceae bacterium]
MPKRRPRKTNRLNWMVAALLAPSLAQGQTFEAASIMPANPNLPDGHIVVGMRAPLGGPGTDDPGRIRYPIISLRFLIGTAYNLKPTEKLTGPDWLDSDFFQIEATMPPATTMEQFRTMLQNLLADRFQLKVHRESKQTAIYALVVAKNGPKLKESKEQQDVPLPEDAFAHRPQGPPNLGPDGFPAHPNVPAIGAGIFTTVGTKGIRLTARQQTMQDLAHTLNAFARRPVVDQTGLTVKYDFVLTFFRPGATTPDGEALPEIFSAIQSQLGLRLETQKGTAETLAVDHVEKTPTAN